MQSLRESYISKGIEIHIHFHSDHLGSAGWISNSSGAPVQHLQYRPFGEPFVDEKAVGSDYDERFTFTGKERDEETGYYYHGARFHWSDIGWLSVDPLSDKYPSTSPYMYCLGNPMILVDPNGRFSIKTHKQMLSSAMAGTNLNVSAQKSMLQGTGNKADLSNMFTSSVHLDGLSNFTDVFNGYTGASTNFANSMATGNYSEAGLSLHTIGDFYSHSNYIDIYVDYAQGAGITLDINNVPTFDEAMNIPGLSDKLKEGLKTGTFSPLNDSFTKKEDSHGQMNLDTNKGNGAKPFGNTGSTKHEAAKRTAEKDINNKIKQNVPQNTIDQK